MFPFTFSSVSFSCFLPPFSLNDIQTLCDRLFKQEDEDSACCTRYTIVATGAFIVSSIVLLRLIPNSHKYLNYQQCKGRLIQFLVPFFAKGTLYTIQTYDFLRKFLNKNNIPEIHGNHAFSLKSSKNIKEHDQEHDQRNQLEQKMKKMHRSNVVTEKCYPFVPTDSISLIFSEPLKKQNGVNFVESIAPELEFFADVYSGNSALTRSFLNRKNNSLVHKELNAEDYLNKEIFHAFREIRRRLPSTILYLPKLDMDIDECNKASMETDQKKPLLYTEEPKFTAKTTTTLTANLWTPILFHVDDRTKQVLFHFEHCLAIEILFNPFLVEISPKEGWKIVNSCGNHVMENFVICSSEHKFSGVSYDHCPRGSLFQMKKTIEI